MPTVGRFGPSGGTGGTSFDATDPVDPMILTNNLSVIHLRSGGRINQIQSDYVSPGPGGPIVTKSGAAGGGGGDPGEVQIPSGVFVVRIDGTISDENRVGSLQFTLSDNSKSKLFGVINNKAERFFYYIAPPGFHIFGFFGNAGDELDALGVTIRSNT
jgi:hypothetical protein